jgi:hypothetical protein
VSRDAVRKDVLDLLASRYRPAPQPRDDEAEKLRTANTRAWLLYILPLVAESDTGAAEVLRRALDKSEKNKWPRYWALAGQLRFAYPGLTSSVVSELIAAGGDDLVLLLAHAIKAARDGDDNSLAVVKDALVAADPNKQWAALRAIRVIVIDDGEIINQLCKFVDVGANSDLTYDAIQVLSSVAPTSDYAKVTGRTLANFVDRWSTYPGRDAMRLRAIAGLGRLGRSSDAQVLVEQLLDENPAIVRASARALEMCLGARPTVDRVLSEAARSYDGVRSYALALRWLERREEVVDQLALAMSSGATELRDIARGLLSEVGGMAAMERLRVQSNLMSQHAAFLKDSEEHVQRLFESSIHDAHTGFRRTLFMDQLVFCLGVLLIGSSSALLLKHDGKLAADWVGTGATGVLGVLYTLFLAKPRQQVERGVDHLMRLKVVFLGFLRQLHQADSAYIRRLLDDRSVSSEDLKGFTDLIESAKDKAAAQLTSNGAA